MNEGDAMDEVEKLLSTAVTEVEKILSSKTVVGEPITVGETTLIPLVSVGFGFGAGGGPQPGAAGQGTGGTGGGGGIKPVAVVIIDQNGARLEAIKGGTATMVEKIAEAVAQGVRKEKSSRAGEQG